MCQRILQLCSDSTRPLLVAGGLMSLLLAIAIGYAGCTTNALLSDIDLEIAKSQSLYYHIQLATAAYLVLVTVLTLYTVYYDHKHSMGALAAVSAVTFVLALLAVLMIPPGDQFSKPFEKTLAKAVSMYNFKDKPALQASSAAADGLGPEALPALSGGGGSTSQQAASTANSSAPNNRLARWADPEMTADNATKIWDSLQARGCCGLNNSKTDWKDKIPKSCCSNPTAQNEEYVCKEADQKHQLGCLALIGSSSFNLMIVLGLIALVNFYMATISGISTYKTYSYSEASQNAYT